MTGALGRCPSLRVKAARHARISLAELLALTERSGVISFAGGLPAPELFDVTGLRAAFATVLGGDGAAGALQYSTTEGNPLLRAGLDCGMRA